MDNRSTEEEIKKLNQVFGEVFERLIQAEKIVEAEKEHSKEKAENRDIDSKVQPA
jgi:hypothetical protein